MNTRVRREERAPCLRDSGVEDGVHPRTPIAVRKAQGILKITLKVKTVKVDTGSLNHEGKSSVSKMMISPNLGSQKRKDGHATDVTCLIHDSPETPEYWFDDLPLNQ
ncbi:hypothetical protein Tco_0281009 [Tanacetum coccineum]